MLQKSSLPNSFLSHILCEKEMLKYPQKDKEYSFIWASKAGLVLQVSAVHNAFFFFSGVLDL